MTFVKRQMRGMTLPVLAAVVFCVLSGCGGGSDITAPATSASAGSEAGTMGIGNNMPSGPHYNLNIIGVKNPKDVGKSQGHTMFVKLSGKTKILMSQNQDGTFEVTDRNGTDGTASFNIGDSDTTDARTHYLVYARALGKPNGSVTITPHASFEGQTGDPLFLLGEVTITRHKKKPKTVNITNLFYVTVTVTIGGVPKTYTNEWVFDIAELLEYYWDYNNNNCKLLQVRFYEDVG